MDDYFKIHLSLTYSVNLWQSNPDLLLKDVDTSVRENSCHLHYVCIPDEPSNCSSSRFKSLPDSDNELGYIFKAIDKKTNNLNKCGKKVRVIWHIGPKGIKIKYFSREQTKSKYSIYQLRSGCKQHVKRTECILTSKEQTASNRHQVHSWSAATAYGLV